MLNRFVDIAPLSFFQIISVNVVLFILIATGTTTYYYYNHYNCDHTISIHISTPSILLVIILLLLLFLVIPALKDASKVIPTVYVPKPYTY